MTLDIGRPWCLVPAAFIYMEFDVVSLELEHCCELRTFK